jgi:hypothetical protein
MTQHVRHSPALSPVVYVVGAVVSASLGLLAMFVAYQILGSDFWTQTLGQNFLDAPPELFDVSLIKLLEVIVAVLAAHYVLKIAGVYRLDPTRPALVALIALMIASIGFLATYNNAQIWRVSSLPDNWAGIVFSLIVFAAVAGIAAINLQLAEKYFLKALR